MGAPRCICVIGGTGRGHGVDRCPLGWCNGIFGRRVSALAWGICHAFHSLDGNHGLKRSCYDTYRAKAAKPRLSDTRLLLLKARKTMSQFKRGTWLNQIVRREMYPLRLGLFLEAKCRTSSSHKPSLSISLSASRGSQLWLVSEVHAPFQKTPWQLEHGRALFLRDHCSIGGGGARLPCILPSSLSVIFDIKFGIVVVRIAANGGRATPGILPKAEIMR